MLLLLLLILLLGLSLSLSLSVVLSLSLGLGLGLSRLRSLALVKLLWQVIRVVVVICRVAVRIEAVGLVALAKRWLLLHFVAGERLLVVDVPGGRVE